MYGKKADYCGKGNENDGSGYPWIKQRQMSEGTISQYRLAIAVKYEEVETLQKSNTFNMHRIIKEIPGTILRIYTDKKIKSY